MYGQCNGIRNCHFRQMCAVGRYLKALWRHVNNMIENKKLFQRKNEQIIHNNDLPVLLKLLQYFGYIPNQEQTVQALNAMKFGFSYLPAIFFIVGGIVMLFYIRYERQEKNILDTLEERRKNWTPREPKVTTGYLARYAAMVTSGNRGAVLEVPKNKQ